MYCFSDVICCSLWCRSAGVNWCSELKSVKAEIWKKGEGLYREEKCELPFNGSVPTKEREKLKFHILIFNIYSRLQFKGRNSTWI